MKRILYLIPIVCLTYQTLYSQKELYFADKVRDSLSIAALQGISVNFSDGHGISIGGIGINYFKEVKLSSTISLTIGLGVVNSSYVKSVIYPDSISYFSKPTIEYKYGIQVNLSAEPRWYFSFKNRYMKGSKTILNSGWFIGLPTELNSSILNSDRPFSMNLLVVPTLGYRYAISPQIFMEAQAGYGFSNLIAQYYNLQTLPYFKLKIGYVF